VTASGIPNKDMLGFGLSDPFFLLCEGHTSMKKHDKPEKDNKLPIHKSNMIKNNPNPVWDAFDLNVNQIGGPDAKLHFKVNFFFFFFLFFFSFLSFFFLFFLYFFLLIFFIFFNLNL
jgi:hypothetical protein